MHKIIKVEIFDNYKVKLEYENGQEAIADLSELVAEGHRGRTSLYYLELVR